jgi:tRNA 2-selenouridine synthase
MEQPERVSPPLSLADFPDIIDVRSPSEFAEDHLPGAINLPVLNDAERQQVGTVHARNPYEARRLGATLITGNIHRHLNTTLARKPPSFAPLIYCWRGNLRSHGMAVIFRAIGWRTRLLTGGYKAWRRFLIGDLDALLKREKPGLVVLGGLTGCAKTRLLHELARQGGQILDLEGLANHKGSILGRSPDSSQPSQKRFESRLWEQFQTFDPDRPVFTEAESNRIGRLQCPPTLWHRLGRSRVILVDLPLSERVRFLRRDYPYFLENPEALREPLNGLRRLRGHDLVDRWLHKIQARDWTGFLESILTDHYDRCYRRPGSNDSIYPEPESTLRLPSAEADDLAKAAAFLLQSTGPGKT